MLSPHEAGVTEAKLLIILLSPPFVTIPHLCHLHLHLSRSLVDRWDDTDDLATSSLHSSRLSAFLMAAYSVMPVHSGMLSSRLFFCLPLLLPPCTVPCRIVLASPADLVTCPYHFSLRLFTVVKMFVGPNGLPSSVSHLLVRDANVTM